MMKTKWPWLFQIQLSLAPSASYLGIPAINQIINVIKESKIDDLSISLNGLRISYLLTCHQAKLSIQKETATN